ncbi:MAG: DUF4013 domain-containing protein [archaeon]
MLDNLTNALKRPFQDGKKILIGCLLNIIPIVSLISQGYTLDCARLTMKKKNNLPEWNKLGKYFVDGLLRSLIGFIWFLPVLILVGIAVGGFLLPIIITAIQGGEIDWSSAIAPILGSVGILVIAAIFFLFIIYLTPAAVLGFVDKGKFKEAFNFKRIFKKAFTGEYFIAWLVSGILGFFGMLIVMGVLFPLMLIPYLGNIIRMIIGSCVGFILGIIQITILADEYRKIKA